MLNRIARRSASVAVTALALFALGAAPLTGQPNAPAPQTRPLRIGIIGGGNMGGPLGVAWAKAAHQVHFVVELGGIRKLGDAEPPVNEAHEEQGMRLARLLQERNRVRDGGAYFCVGQHSANPPPLPPLI